MASFNLDFALELCEKLTKQETCDLEKKASSENCKSLALFPKDSRLKMGCPSRFVGTGVQNYGHKMSRFPKFFHGNFSLDSRFQLYCSNYGVIAKTTCKTMAMKCRDFQDSSMVIFPWSQGFNYYCMTSKNGGKKYRDE